MVDTVRLVSEMTIWGGEATHFELCRAALSPVVERLFTRIKDKHGFAFWYGYVGPVPFPVSQEDAEELLAGYGNEHPL